MTRDVRNFVNFVNFAGTRFRRSIFPSPPRP